MANKIQVKRSAVPAKAPTTTDLDLGEIAINTYDGKMYIKKDDGTQSIVQIGAGGGGSGDVVGPASATDNAITRYDGTTGKLIQNSLVTLDDNGNIQNLNGIAFDTTPTSAPTATGSMFWDDGNGSLSVILDADVELQLGQENLAKVYNGSGSTITKGQVVAVSGAQGQRPSVVLADADSEPLSAGTLGIAAEDIANGAEGFICTFGLVRGINTNGFTAGAPIYLSQTAGAFTATRPSAPAHTVFLGWVISVKSSSGELFVNISNGWELDELHNVLITSPQSGNTLIYDATTAVWKNANLTDGTGITITEGAGTITVTNAGVTSAVAGTGISVSGATGAVTITNTAPDQTVALTAGTGISTSGTYPNFTITNTAPDQTVSIAAGTGMSVTGTYPNFTVTNNDRGSSQNIFKNVAVSGQSTIVADGNDDTLTVAAGTGISLTTNATTDTLTIAATNNGTVTSVSGTGTASGLTLSGTVTTSGSLTLSGTVNSLAAGTYAISISGNAATATTATNQSGGTVAATTGSFSSNLTAGTGVAIDPSNVSGFAAGQITEGTTGFSAPGIVIGSGSGSHGAIVYGAGTMYFGAEAGTDNTMNTRATLSNAGAFNTTGAITQNGSQVLTAGNYNSYAPTLTGGGASGTWGINITGSAGSATTATTATTANGVAAGVVTGKMIYNSFTATASQTTFAPTNTYTSGKIDVYANGVRMVNGSDVTVTSGTSVVFASGLASGTRVDLVYPI